MLRREKGRGIGIRGESTILSFLVGVQSNAATNRLGEFSRATLFAKPEDNVDEAEMS